MFVKLKLHSIVDLITNSSTSIFTTYGERSIESAKKVLDYFLKTQGSDKTVDEVFTVIGLFDEDLYFEAVIDMLKDSEYHQEIITSIFDGEFPSWFSEEEFDDEEAINFITRSIKNVFGNLDKGIPGWFKKAHEILDANDDLYDQEFIIKTNDPKFEHLTKLLLDFISSPEQDASYC